MILNLATTGSSNFPIWMESHSGNASDKKVLPRAIAKMNDLCRNLKDSKEFLYVADSAIYENILSYSEKLKWLSRVPNNIGLAKSLLSKPEEELNWNELSNGYQYHIDEVTYKGVAQRWALIFSEQAYQREIKTLTRNIAKSGEMLEKEWWHMSNELFKCKKDALKMAKRLERKMKYHQVEYEIEEKKKYPKTGRPGRGIEAEVVGYKIKYNLCVDEVKVEEVKKSKGRFILGTNELDKLKLADNEILKEYKAQSGVERGFRFIKDDSFQVDSVYLKTPSRIAALMMIMTLCLMVFGLTEHQIREALKKYNENIPDQRRRSTQKPSLKWVFFLFLGVHETTIKIGRERKEMISNLNEVLRQIIGYCGVRAKEIYFNME